MDLTKKSQLEEIGIDVDSVLDRFMGNEAILMRFLKKFLNDGNYGKLKEAVQTGDMEGALAASHTLKGVTGNLSMTKLYELLTDQVQLFREGKTEEAIYMMDEITRNYQEIVEGIKKVTGE